MQIIVSSFLIMGIIFCTSENTPRPRQILKLPSLFAARFFWTFHNKLHNMKALVILRHHDHHFSYLLVFMKKRELLWVPVSSSGAFSREKKLPTAHCFNIGAHIGICVQISRNTLLYLPSLKRDSPILLLMLISLDLQFQEHSIALRNIY